VFITQQLGDGQFAEFSALLGTCTRETPRWSLEVARTQVAAAGLEVSHTGFLLEACKPASR